MAFIVPPGRNRVVETAFAGLRAERAEKKVKKEAPPAPAAAKKAKKKDSRK